MTAPRAPRAPGRVPAAALGAVIDLAAARLARGLPPGAQPPAAPGSLRLADAGPWQGAHVRVTASGVTGTVLGRQPSTGKLVVWQAGIARAYPDTALTRTDPPRRRR